MLVGTAKECKSVGQAGVEHGDLVAQVVDELMKAVETHEESVMFTSGTKERLAAYTDVVADFPCAVKEFTWRNQYFYNLGNDLCPLHNELLRECQSKGYLSFERL
jgi:Mn-containing catalase